MRESEGTAVLTAALSAGTERSRGIQEKCKQAGELRPSAGTAQDPAAGETGGEKAGELRPSAGTVQDPFLRPGERIDDLQRAGLRIIQDPARFCFGMDAVLLAAYVRMKKARRALDLGTGNGIIPILLSDRSDCPSLTGLEIQPASADLAVRSVALNGLQDRIRIVQGDIREAGRIFAAASFDFITCNPPYRPVGTGRITGGSEKKADARQRPPMDERGGQAQSPPREREAASLQRPPMDERGGQAQSPPREEKAGGRPAGMDPEGPGSLDPRAIARHELLCTFDDVADAAARLLRPGGHFYLVHRPLRLAEILSKLCACGLEPKRLRLVFPHIGQAPNLFLVDCVRGGSPELRVEPPLIVYGEDGSYTQELLDIYNG